MIRKVIGGSLTLCCGRSSTSNRATPSTRVPLTDTLPPSFPDTASLSALRAWYAGVAAHEAVERYCPQALEGSQSARGVIGRIRRQLAGFALSRHRADLARLFQCAVGERSRHRKAATRALDILPTLSIPQPQVSDAVDDWLPARVVPMLHQHGIRTLADLTVRIPRRQRWWRTIAGLGVRSARHIRAFFASHPVLTERARALILVATPEPAVPRENIPCHMTSTARAAPSAHRGRCARSRPITTIRRSAPGSTGTKPPKLSVPIAGKPSACCAGRLPSAAKRCLRSRARMRPLIVPSCAIPPPRPVGRAGATPRSSSEWRPFTARCRQIPSPMRCQF
ncbi:hypothetical protein QF025_006878 [Paraburkholderia graminis]|uniref:Integrase n=1 Tax=Paraburkholderia graminis TaxID=60548 RepID=A0ABD5CS25_9BURK|nr:hypothetical protein [Paraburkholderia graminis]